MTDEEQLVANLALKCPECGTKLSEKIEERTEGVMEFVNYCEGCGYTESS